jgi:hypothetical protein
MSSTRFEMRGEWIPTVKQISTWVAAGGTLRFGHVKAPHATGKTTFLPTAIWSAVKLADHNTMVYHVLPDSEVSEVAQRAELARAGDPNTSWHADQISRAGLRDPKPGHMPICSYSTVTGMISNSLRNSKPPKHLGKPLLLIVDLDLQCPADLALLLVAVATRAMPAGQPGEPSCVTVLTMSPSDPPRYLEKLLLSYNPGLVPQNRVQVFQPPVEEQHEPTRFVCAEQEALPDKIYEQISLRPEGETHLILLMSHGTEHYNVQDKLGQYHIPCMEMREPVGNLSPQALTAEHQYRADLLRPVESRTRCMVAVHQGGTWHFRGHISGYDNIHIVARQSRMRTVFDRETAQLVNIETPYTLEERRDIIAWVSRTTAAVRNVYILGKQPMTMNEYLQAAPQHERLHVANTHALGFLTMLTRYQHRIPDLKSVIQSFVPRDVAVVIIQRGVQLGVFSYDSAARLPTLKSVLLEPQRAIFETLVPVCNYDVRLALLLSLPNSSPFMGTIKLDLAAILACVATTGLHSLFSWDRSRKPESVNELFKSCSFSLQNVLHSGATWVMLGLWYDCLKTIHRHNEPRTALYSTNEFEGREYQLAEFFKKSLDKGFMFAAPAVLRIWSKRASLLAGLPSYRIPIETAFIQDEQVPYDVFNDLDHQLLQVFVHGMCAVEINSNRMIVFDYVCGKRLEASDAVTDMTSMVDTNEPQDGRVYGLYMSPLQRTPGLSRSYLLDWMEVPADVFEVWIQKQPQLKLRQLIRADIELCRNTDEFTEA